MSKKRKQNKLWLMPISQKDRNKPCFMWMKDRVSREEIIVFTNLDSKKEVISFQYKRDEFWDSSKTKIWQDSLVGKKIRIIEVL